MTSFEYFTHTARESPITLTRFVLFLLGYRRGPFVTFFPHRNIGHVVQGESRKGRLSFVVVVCLFVCFCISALLCDCRVFFRSLE